MKRKIIVLLMFLFLIVGCGKKNEMKEDIPEEEMIQKDLVVFDDSKDVSSFNNIIEDGEKNYIVVGSSTVYSNNYRMTEAIIVKYDHNLNMIWSKNYSIDKEEAIFNEVIESQDGGYIAFGVFGNADGNAILVKYDKLGNLEWEKKYTKEQASFSKIIYNSVDGSFTIFGQKLSPINDLGALIIHCDKDGNVVWEQQYGKQNAAFIDAIQLSNGDYLTVGYVENENNKIPLIVKYNNNGELLLEQNLNKFGYVSKIKQDANGDFIITGTYASDSKQNLIIEYDSNITELKSTIVSIPFFDFIVMNNTYLFAGSDENNKAYIAKYSLDGELWKKDFSEGEYEYYNFLFLIISSDEKYVAVGNRYSPAETDEYANQITNEKGQAVIKVWG